MIKSMTGFGRGDYDDGRHKYTVEIKSVNHRYNDVSTRMSRRYNFVEDKIIKAIKSTVKRGKTEASLHIDYITGSDKKIDFDEDLASQYVSSLIDMKEKFALEDDISLGLLATMPDVIKVTADEDDEAELTAGILGATEKAVAALDEMRRTEGEKLAEDLTMRGRKIAEMVAEIEELTEDLPKDYASRLEDRMKDILDGRAEVEPERIATEAAIFADKSDITEELTRLRSHTDQLADIIAEASEPSGKKLDFLSQEMNREANTIASKANDMNITATVLDVKSEIEKIREQVQNIE